jgi:glucan endo-1,3-beta-D-glucosidase
MRTSTFLSVASALSTSVSATVYQGFNYGSTFTSGAAKVQSDFEAEFTAAQNLVGTSGAFTSARLYTMIQGTTTADPIEAIPAAIKTKTSLLLGIWASGGATDVTNEISALTAAITNYGTDFTDLVVGLSVGSEDLYRVSTTGIENDSGVGAGPATLVDYITQVKTALKGTALENVLIGHVDTWNSWTNSTNAPVIAAIDWLGVDEYPYFQNTVSNSIDSAYDLFWEAYNATAAAGGGKPVWITETGWPVSGKTENLGVPSIANAKTFYDEIGCASAFGKVNTWWYVLQDAAPTTPVPSFGVLGSSTSDATLGTTPLYDLSCANVSLPASLLPSAATSGSTATKTGSSSGSQTSAGGSGGSGSTTGTTSSPSASTTKSSGASTFAASGLFLVSAMFVALF